MDRARLCLIGGDLVPESEARVSVLDRGFLYGEGLFETLRIYRGRPFLLADHWARLEASAAFVNLPVPDVDPAELVSRVVEANGLTDATVRMTLTRGAEPLGPRPGPSPRPTLLVQVRPLRPGLEEAANRGVEGRRLPWPLRARGMPLHNHKTLAYLPSVVALGAVEPGAEPILENTEGDVAEGATSNVFWASHGRVYTPHPDAGCLPGVTRRIVLDLARSQGIEIEEGFFPWPRLADADEAFLTNSVVEVVPLIRLDACPVGAGRPGPVTRGLQSAYRDLVTREGGEP